MDPADSQRERALLYERYRGMTDEELENIAAAAYELTDVACESLRHEIASRRLAVSLNLDPAAVSKVVALPQPVAHQNLPTPPDTEEAMNELPPEDDGFVPDDRDLAWIYTAYEFDELLQIKRYLNQARIECFFGDEKLRDVRKLPPIFHGDMEIRVWVHQLQDAQAVLTACVPGFGAQQEPPNLEMRCPRCHSDGVIFEERDLKTSSEKVTNQSKFRWRCDDCGHEWKDDGIVQM